MIMRLLTFLFWIFYVGDSPLCQKSCADLLAMQSGLPRHDFAFS